MSEWLATLGPQLLPEFDGESAMLPPDLDALVGPESMAAWDEQVRDIIIPAVVMIWCYSFAQTAYVFGADMLADTRPAMTADGAPDDDRPPWEIPGNPGYVVPLSPEKAAAARRKFDEDRRAELEHPKIQWTTDPATGAPVPVGTPDNPYGLSDMWTQDTRTPEERKRRAAQINKDLLNPEPVSRGISPDGKSANWTSDFPTWLAHVRSEQAVFRDVAERTGGGPAFGEYPPEAEPRFPSVVWIRPGIPEQTPANTRDRSRTSKRWVEANWPTPIRDLTKRQMSKRDLVGRMVALAWETNPEQVKQTALLVWDQVSNKRRLEMFIGSYGVSQSIPGRVRDLLVGSTNNNTRRAIPMGEFRAELGLWLKSAISTTTGVLAKGAKHISYHLPRRERARWDTEADVRADRVLNEGSDVYEPGPARPAVGMWERHRALARESGLQAAGIINQGMLSAAASSGIDFDKVWCAHMDRRTRDTHYVADGQRVSVDGDFTVGGAKLDYPGDPSGPSQEISNCRCRVGMTDIGEALPPEQRRNSAQKNEIIHRSRQGLIRARDDQAGLGYIPPDNAVMTAALDEQEYDMINGEFRTFTDSVVAFIGTPTSDGRMLAKGISLTFRAFPLPLMWMKQGADGHTAAYTVGVIESAEQREDTVVASGYLLNTPEADEAADQLAHGVTRPSVDLAAATWIATDADGCEITEDADVEAFMTMTEAELIGTTLVATPAFGDTAIELNHYRESRDVALVAAAADEFRPRVYDHRLFDNPNLPGPTLPTMGDDGRVYGHLACFGECHRSIQSECVIAPRSRSEYAHFHTSPALRLDDGARLPVGRLTVGTGHAHSGASPRAAAAHYDNTGTCFALVRVGEDAHGIWFSGVAAPWATTAQIEQGLSSPLSGDWRDFGQGLELVAALAVNTPGFAARGRSDEQGRPIALVAALGPTEDMPSARIEAFSVEDIKTAVKDALAETRQESEQAQLEADRSALLDRAAQVTTPPTPNDEIAAMLAGH